MMKPALICIVGPTASGKSALAVSLARALDGEVVSADSMQIYRSMDIGTAKITADEMKGVPHHGIDLLEPWEHYHVQAFQGYARRTIDEIALRGRVPILCGGTGLFVHSVLFPMGFTQAGEDSAIRGRLTREADERGAKALHQRLEAVDPVSAQRIHPNNLKRVIRALEVFELTGKPMSSFDEGSFDCPQALYQPLLWIGLTLDRTLLRERIDRRVDEMVAAGLVEEAARLWEKGLRPQTHSAMQGIGYRQLAPYFLGELPLEPCIERVKIETRQFAKRQMSWFKREQAITWMDAGLGTEALTRAVLARIGRKQQ
jgi:tRNA dimethylallyltransferase